MRRSGPKNRKKWRNLRPVAKVGLTNSKLQTLNSEPEFHHGGAKEHKGRNEIRFGVHGDDKRRVTPPIAANEKKRPALAGLATKVGRTASVPSQ